MNDRLDPVVANEASDEGLVAAVAGDQRHAIRDGRGESGRKIVEHDDALAGVAELKYHVAADIAGAAGDQDRHAVGSAALATRSHEYFEKIIADGSGFRGRSSEAPMTQRPRRSS